MHRLWCLLSSILPLAARGWAVLVPLESRDSCWVTPGRGKFAPNPKGIGHMWVDTDRTGCSGEPWRRRKGILSPWMSLTLLCHPHSPSQHQQLHSPVGTQLSRWDLGSLILWNHEQSHPILSKHCFASPCGTVCGSGVWRSSAVLGCPLQGTPDSSRESLKKRQSWEFSAFPGSQLGKRGSVALQGPAGAGTPFLETSRAVL